MNKCIHFLGQPLYSQILNLLDKSNVLKHSRIHTGERYVKSFDAWPHLLVMLCSMQSSIALILCEKSQPLCKPMHENSII